MTPLYAAKAIIAALIAGLTAIGTALTDGGITPDEWVAAIVAALVALGAVYGVSNGPPAPRRHNGPQV